MSVRYLISYLPALVPGLRCTAAERGVFLWCMVKSKGNYNKTKQRRERKRFASVKFET